MSEEGQEELLQMRSSELLGIWLSEDVIKNGGRTAMFAPPEPAQFS